MKRKANKITQWHDIDWVECSNKLEIFQHNIAVAFRKKELELVKHLQHNLVKSFAARALSVKIVTENAGKNTPGIDGEIWDSPSLRWSQIEKLLDLSEYKAKPVRRIYIPKDGARRVVDKKKARFLGIPTMYDRTVQTLWNLALQPIAEETGDRHSYGFRARRSALDALAITHNHLSRTHRPMYILDVDIKGFFSIIFATTGL
jgi:RNA-directed DNA polymerase